MTRRSFNPETVCNVKASIGCDELYRWAAAISGASGSIQGTHLAFEEHGGIPELAEEAEHLRLIRNEITDASRRQ